MEASSPLAALQPGGSLLPPWGHHEDAVNYGSGFLRPCSFGANSFNFRDMSMAAKSKPDYFSCRPIRGSSPAASLAVDLSQNFHIDKSPQLPTPRRSLFTSNLLDASQRRKQNNTHIQTYKTYQMLTSPVANVITPPIPSSSPAPLPDSMEFSPLPHKQPQIPSTTFALCSPTPEATPVLEQEELAPPPFHRPHSQPIALQSPPGRRASAGGRPTFRKGYSSTAIVPKPRSSSSSHAPFMFGAGSTFMPKAPLESFAESPPSERKAAAFNANGSSRGPSMANSPFLASGSPIAPVRRPPPRVGRLGMGRRSHSVQYSNPFKPMRQEKRCCTTGCYQPSSSIGLEASRPKLPHFVPQDDPESLPRITKETAVDLLNGAFTDLVGSHVIIDCRFEYEYQGGHINGAHNFNDKEELAKQLFETNSLDAKALIFHCEYSACRAPIMASFIRQRDRSVNQDNYPFLTYPEIYILDGGYSGFFKEYSMHCFPQNYVEMNDEKFENACELGMARVKRRAKLSRAQTYAFGQTSAKSTTEEASLPSIIMTSYTSVDSMELDSPSLQAPAAYPPRIPRRLDSY